MAKTKEGEKKIGILYVLEILKKYSDEKHLLKYNDIIDLLKQDYGVVIERKAIARNIDTLMEFGYEIVKRGNTGCYLGYRDFDKGELLFLIDAIYSSKSISSKYAKELIDKITVNCSKYDKDKICRVEKVDESNVINKQIFYNLEILYEAIERKKKVKFQYNEYSLVKGITASIPRNNGKEYIINPYHLINNRGKYYLLCNYDKYDNLSNYKIENISNVEILNEDTKPLESLIDGKDFSIKTYIKEHIYMTHGNSVRVTMRLSSNRVINDVMDWFGNNIRVYSKNDETYVSLKVNEQALVYWALQYGKEVEIVSPNSTVELIKESINSLYNKYNKIQS